MLSDDAAPPVDRPNLSKDYLAGNAPEEWVPLRDDDFYAEQRIDLRLKTTVTAHRHGHARGRARRRQQDRVRPAAARDRRRAGAAAAAGHGPAARAHAAHARRLPRHHRAGGNGAQRAVVMGASFIGLEVAASLRARGIEVHVVAPDKRPMERVLGPQMGDFVRSLHEEHGVIFHLEDTATRSTRAR